MAKTLPHLVHPPAVQQQLGRRLKALRLQVGFKRTTLADRAGVSARSLQRFEDSGEVSLKSLLKLAHALGRLPEFTELLALPEVASLAELENRRSKPAPKRGRI